MEKLILGLITKTTLVRSVLKAKVRKTIEKRLSQDGHTVITSPDGLAAYKIIEKESFDLIISDIAMPFLSGFELLNYLKKAINKVIPVILISALDQKEIMVAAFKSGARTIFFNVFTFDIYNKYKILPFVESTFNFYQQNVL